MFFHRFIFTLLVLLLIGVAAIGVLKVLPTERPHVVQVLLPRRAERPYGMAPVAWHAYLRACHHAKVHPFRIGQTIGDHPRSVGYHKRDGVLGTGKSKVDYTAAVNLGTWDLPSHKINAFVEALTTQGFAAFYRHGAKWKGNEHIHAIYAFLPMKPQLRFRFASFCGSGGAMENLRSGEENYNRSNESSNTG